MPGAFPFPIKKLLTSVTAHETTVSDKWLSPCYGENSLCSLLHRQSLLVSKPAREQQEGAGNEISGLLEGHEDIAQLINKGVSDTLWRLSNLSVLPYRCYSLFSLVK